MKICPQCQTSYTDDNLKFCLQDGKPLVGQVVSQDWSESETLVSPKSFDRTQVDYQNPTTPDWTNSEQRQVIAPPKKSAGWIVALTALITLLVVGGGAAGYLFYQNNQKVETAQNSNISVKPVNVSVPNNANGNQKSNANRNIAPSPTAAPSVKPTLNSKEIESVKSDVGSVIENWKDSTENRDIDSHLDDYADTVDYYNAGKVSSSKVRADREKAFAMYDNLEVNLDNVKITPDETGEKAVVTFDKEWNFQTDGKSSSGKVQQQLTFARIKGRWLITGEKDLKVYYANK